MGKLLITLIIIPYLIMSQDITTETIFHDGLERSYILYVPTSYSENSLSPLVLNLHGYSSNAGQQMIYSNFHAIAEDEGFILIHPEGTTDANGFQFWNTGSISTVDDVSFLSALIDTIAFEYNINTSRVYSMGMSNGGFMSYQLACQLSDKITAIASVTGSMTTNQISSCSPEYSVPVIQIHGTSDVTVPYNGNNLGGISSIDNVIEYWTNFNMCDVNPIINNIPDINLLDLCSAEHYVYSNGDNGSSVELYKIINGGHTWPGAAIPLVGNNTNQDFSASQKIWEFFSQYDINGLINTSGNIKELNPRKTVRETINILGQTSKKTNIYIDLYDDGSAEKKHLIK